jgi:hypothetical protein
MKYGMQANGAYREVICAFSWKLTLNPISVRCIGRSPRTCVVSSCWMLDLDNFCSIHNLVFKTNNMKDLPKVCKYLCAIRLKTVTILCLVMFPDQVTTYSCKHPGHVQYSDTSQWQLLHCFLVNCACCRVSALPYPTFYYRKTSRRGPAPFASGKQLRTGS